MLDNMVYTVDEVAEIFKTSKTSVYAMRNQGKLHQLKNVAGIKFSAKEVHALIGIEDEYTPLAYRKLKKELENLKQENQMLKNRMKKITSEMLVIVGDNL